MSNEIERLNTLLERLIYAYHWWRECEYLNKRGQYDLDESNRRLSEMCDVYGELTIARNSWVESMPDGLREQSQAILKKQADQRLDRYLELLDDYGVLDDVIAPLDASVQAKADPNEHG